MDKQHRNKESPICHLTAAMKCICLLNLMSKRYAVICDVMLEHANNIFNKIKYINKIYIYL